jgi:glycosyl transferase family 87
MARTGLRQHIAGGTRLSAGPAGALWLVVLAGCAWGARSTFLEGFRDARPRGFAGDFTTAMFTNQYWDGTGVLYGPVFVFERWLVDAAPGVFTPTFFAVACIPLVAAAFAVLVRAFQLPLLPAALVLTLWLCFSRLSYSFSVAANPEFLELAFIAGAVALAVRSGRRDERGEGALLGAAALTKYVPWALVPGLLARRRWQAIVGVVVCFVVLAVVTAIGQGTGPVETVGDILFPVGSYADGQLFAARVDTAQFLDVVTAIGRLFSDTALTDTQKAIAVGGGIAVMAAAFAAAMLGLWHVTRARMPVAREAALVAALTFGLLPIITPSAHPHTFLFLLPVWAAFVALVFDAGVPRGLRLGIVVFGLLTFTATGFVKPYEIADRVLGLGLLTSPWVTEPMFATLVAFAMVVVCAAVIGQRAREASPHPGAVAVAQQAYPPAQPALEEAGVSGPPGERVG